MNTMEEIVVTRSRIEISANDMKINTTDKKNYTDQSNLAIVIGGLNCIGGSLSFKRHEWFKDVWPILRQL